MRKTPLFKTLACVLAFEMLFLNSAQALDVRQLLLDAKSSFAEFEDDKKLANSLSPDQQAALEYQQSEEVSQQNELQDLEELNFSLKTTSGDIVKYVGDHIDSIQRPDGTVLKNVVLDAQGNISSSDLLFGDGSIQVLRDGKILGYTKPDGTMVEYEAATGRVSKVTSSVGVVSLYTYELNTVTGSILKTFVSSTDAQGNLTRGTYDAEGVLTRLERPDGITVNYESGMAKSVVKNGVEHLFVSQTLADGSIKRSLPQGSPTIEDNESSFEEINGVLVIEAENYHTLNAPSAKIWTYTTNAAQYSMGGGVFAGPDSGNTYGTSSELTNNSTRLDYKVYVTSPGTYYLWVRGYAPNTSGDSVYAGLDGVVPVSGQPGYYIQNFTSGQTSWSNKNNSSQVVKFNVTTAGEHTVNFWMREDGFVLDKFILTQNAAFVPSGASLAESAHRAYSGSDGFKETVLPVSIYNTSYAIYSTWGWSKVTSENALKNYGADDRKIAYNVNLSSPSSLKIEFEAINFTENIYAGFKYTFDVYVDGVKRGVYDVAGSKTVWNKAHWTLDNLSAGQHTILLHWTNDEALRNADGTWAYDANIKIRGLKFSQVNAIQMPVILDGAGFPQEMIYDSDGKIKEVLLDEGTRLFFEAGNLTRAVDAEGEAVDFAFEESLLSNIFESTLAQNGVNSIYDSQGRLARVKLEGLTVHFDPDTQTIDHVETQDGTRFDDLVYDEAGNVTGSVVEDLDGNVRVYEGGKLTRFLKSDGTVFFYDQNGDPIKLKTPEALIYTFDYTSPGEIKANLELPEGTVPDALTPIQMTYDGSFNLKKILRQNNEVLSYLNNDLVKIDVPSEVAKLFTYTRDAEGKVTQTLVKQDNVETTYDEFNNPVRSIINPTAENPHSFEVKYQYGKIREVLKNGSLILKYSYEYDAQGNETTQVEDLVNQETLTYVNGQVPPKEELNPETKVLSTYYYDESGRVDRVEVSRLGRHLQTYDYSYSGANTVVADDDGIRRTYNADKKLVYLEKDGNKYQYAYHLVQGEEEVTHTEVIPHETVLPVGIYDTSYISYASYWEWRQITSENALRTYGAGDRKVEYTVNLAEAGDLKLEFDAINFSENIYDGYKYKFDIYVDGVKAGLYEVAGSKTVWNHADWTLNGLSQGQHKILLHWTNDEALRASDGTWTYDANIKIKNFKLTHKWNETVTTTVAEATAPVEITEETLVERTLGDGSKVSYAGGEVTSIELPDGAKIENIVLDNTRGIESARITQTSGVKLTFKEGQILKEELPDGRVYAFSSNELQKVIDPNLGTLEYSYERNGSGALMAVWIKHQGVNFKYNASGVLLGVKIDAIDDVNEARQLTQHTYQGGTNGPLSIDGNYATYQIAQESCTGCGGAYAQAYSTHTFATPQNITQVAFRLNAYGYATGNYIRNHSVQYGLEILRNGLWESVPGTYQSASGGDGSHTIDSAGKVTVNNLNLTGVEAIRAFASGGGSASGGEGQQGGAAIIYEIEYTLTDQSYYAASQTANAEGAMTSLELKGDWGRLTYDASGNLTSSSNASLANFMQPFAGLIEHYAQNPHGNKIAAPLNAELAVWYTDVEEAVLGASEVYIQEYSADGTLETQTKADQTTTLFENNKPALVVDAQGNTLIEYSYDAEGHPSKIYLKNARDVLPDEVAKARSRIEEQRAQTLRNLAEQKALVITDIKTQAANARASVQSNVNTLSGQLSSLEAQGVHGSAAKKAKSQALDQIRSSMDTQQTQMNAINRQEADAYAQLDTQVRQVSDQINFESAEAMTELSNEEKKLKEEILLQEISPIVFDYYRRTLGRDPTSSEYEVWTRHVDFESGLNGGNVLIQFPALPVTQPVGTVIQTINALDFHGPISGFLTVDSQTIGLTSNDTLGYYVFDLPAEAHYSLKFSTAQVTSFTTPPGYQFNFNIYVDGVLVGNFNTPSSTTFTETPSIDLGLLEAGNHELSLQWTNDYYSLPHDANVGIRQLKILQGAVPPLPPSPLEGIVQNGMSLTQALAAYLNQLPELAERRSYVASIKAAVRTQVNQYLAMNAAQKTAFAQTLGLAPADVTALDAADAAQILAWLDSRSLHFGQSAFLALESLLDQKGITYTRENLATQAILIDILSGVITPLDEGDLLISVYALQKAGSLHGLTTSALNLSWDDLLSIYSAKPNARIVAHINDIHYVVITGINAVNKTITYTDMGIGRDKQNESVTASQEDFLKSWKGNVFTDTANAQGIENSAAKILSVQETMKIRGAFFAFLIPVIAGFFSSLGGAVATIAAFIGNLAISIGSFIGNLLVNIGAAIGGFIQGFAGLAVNIFQGIHLGVTSLFNGIGSFFGGLFSGQGFASIGNFVFGNSLLETAAKLGLNLALNTGLEALGVSPEITRYASAFVSGGILGGFGSVGSFIQSGLLNITPTLGQDLGVQLDIDPNLRLAIGVFADGLLGDFTELAIPGQASTTIASSLTQAAIFYGISELGDAVGLDPHLTNAIALPIAGNLGNGFQTGNLIGKQLIQSVQEGLIQGIISYGVNLAGDAISDDPLFSSFASRLIAGAIEGAIHQGDIVGGVTDALKQSFIGVFGATEKDRLQGIVQFSSLVGELGFENALNSYLTNIFDRDTVESVLRSGGIASAFLSPKELTQLPMGDLVNRVVLSNGEGVLFDASNNPIGFQRGGQYQIGDFGINNQGDFGLLSGTAWTDLGNGQFYEFAFDGGNVIGVRVVANGPNLVIAPEGENQWIRIDVNGEFENVVITADNQVEYTINNTILKGIKIVRDVQNETAEFFQQRVVIIQSAIDSLLSVNPSTNIYNLDGTASADMHLDWWNVYKQDLRMTIADYISLSTTANERWLNSVIGGAEKVKLLADNPTNKFIYVPGVNSGIQSLENPTYSSMGDIEKLAQSFQSEGKSVIFAHSAGTEAVLRAINDGARADFYIFASPRVRRSTFIDYLKRNNIRPEQVLVVTATDDLPHWPTDLVSQPWDIASYNPVEIGMNTWNSMFYDYENSQGTYNYLFLSDVVSSTNDIRYLKHGGMINGAIDDQRYNGTINEEGFIDARLKDIYRDFVTN